jgi:hypothetical protein
VLAVPPARLSTVCADQITADRPAWLVSGQFSRLADLYYQDARNHEGETTTMRRLHKAEQLPDGRPSLVYGLSRP